MFLSGKAGRDVLRGGAGDDILYGFEGDDTLYGNGGDDVLAGHEGNDSLSGGTGDDYLLGGLGTDVIDGGAGVDWAAYEDAAAAVNVSLALTGWQATGGAGSDKLVGIENLYGSAYGDTLIGDAGVNYLSGGAGDDRLEGGAGDDHLEGGLGRDTIIGGDGQDVVSYADHGELGVVANLSPTASVFEDRYIGIEDVYATDGSDSIVGNAGSNVLMGRGGNDFLDGGGAGDDVLDGGSGQNRYNVALSHAGHITIVGGGTDQLHFIDTLAGQPPSADGRGVTIDLGISTQQQVTATTTMSISSIEEVLGTPFADTFYAGDNFNNLLGMGGDDRFIFRTLAELGNGDDADIIQFFQHTGDKAIVDLSAIDANTNQEGDQAFVLLPFGFGFTGHAGEITQTATTVPERAGTTLRFDVNGDGVADASLFVVSSASISLDNLIL